jgi:hypothetical protein
VYLSKCTAFLELDRINFERVCITLTNLLAVSHDGGDGDGDGDGDYLTNLLWAQKSRKHDAPEATVVAEAPATDSSR